jgi:hypothetical protein
VHPDERQLTKGINSTDVPAHLQSMVDSLVWESTRIEERFACDIQLSVPELMMMQ